MIKTYLNMSTFFDANLYQEKDYYQLLLEKEGRKTRINPNKVSFFKNFFLKSTPIR